MKNHLAIGISLILGAIGVLIPYLILTITFDYPNILRQDESMILTKFYEGGNALIWTWWAFAILGLPLLVACVQLGQVFEKKLPFIRWATTFGLIGLIVQMIGLLRWTFVVPVLAQNFIAGDEMTKKASKLAFQIVHQYGGVVLGEHIGQIFTIIWTIILCFSFSRLQLMPKWSIGLGYVASSVYLLAQAELFATVMPNFPVIDTAGFIGSTLWIIWLIILGLILIRAKKNQIREFA